MITKSDKIISIFILCIFVVAAVAGLYLRYYLTDKYYEALTAIENEDYERGIELLTGLGSYKDAPEKLEQVKLDIGYVEPCSCSCEYCTDNVE